MRRTLALGLGLSGLLAGSAAGQFGSPAAPPEPAPFGGGVPVGTPSVPARPMLPPGAGGYVAPVGGFQPAPAANNGFRPANTPQSGGASRPIVPVEIPLALGPNHPLAVKPEDGTYFICVRSYSRPHKPDAGEEGYTVKQLAEALANDIQQTQRARVFLYEMISDEKRAEAEARTAARQRAAEFQASLEALKQKSELQGMEFLGTDQAIKFQSFHYRDQVAVFVGGFKTEDEAVKALGLVKKWPVPRDKRLMDGAAITTNKNGKFGTECAYINPYASAMVVLNPTLPKQMAPAAAPMLDSFTMRLNADNPYSLLKTTKGWTLAVKSFHAPARFASKNEDSSMMRRIGSSSANVLRAGAEQAEALAKLLREMKGPGGNSLNIDAYVLHTRTSSVVTVGEFDSPYDPELIEKQRILSNIKFNASRDATGTQIVNTSAESFLSDKIIPIPIPKH